LSFGEGAVESVLIRVGGEFVVSLGVLGVQGGLLAQLGFYLLDFEFDLVDRGRFGVRGGKVFVGRVRFGEGLAGVRFGE
jgi:hypothetical protein